MWVLLQVVVCPGNEDPDVFLQDCVCSGRKYPGVFDKLPFFPDHKNPGVFTIFFQVNKYLDVCLLVWVWQMFLCLKCLGVFTTWYLLGYVRYVCTISITIIGIS